jgi:hypothetical protein
VLVSDCEFRVPGSGSEFKDPCSRISMIVIANTDFAERLPSPRARLAGRLALPMMCNGNVTGRAKLLLSRRSLQQN